jgi:hypothetical protein
MHSVTTHWTKDGCPLVWLSKSTTVPVADAEVPVNHYDWHTELKKCKGTFGALYNVDLMATLSIVRK